MRVNDEYKWMTWLEVRQYSEILSHGLVAKGFVPEI